MNANEPDVAAEPGRIRQDIDARVTPPRPWLLIIASILLAGLATWTGFQWKKGADQEVKLRGELKQVYLEAEQLRLQAVQAQQRVSLLEKQVMALSAEREATTKRIEELEAELTKARQAGKKPPAPVKPAPPKR